jgi:transcriptional regulator
LIYNPQHYKSQNLDLIHKIMLRYNFATLISVVEGSPIISHLPLIFEPQETGKGLLIGHMAKANPMWKSFGMQNKITIIFNGPHAYISPRWYQPKADNVPTWNYAVVHVEGVARIIDSANASYEKMQDLVKKHDPDWKLSLSDEHKSSLLSEIVAFEIDILEIHAKFKLSQNQHELNRDEVIRQLASGTSDLERETASLMGFGVSH